MKTLIVLFISVLSLSAAAQATMKYDLSDIARETRMSGSKGGNMIIVWWIPSQFWTAALQSSGKGSAESMESFKALDEYNLFILVNGSVSAFGGSTFEDADAALKNIVMKDNSGHTYTPLKESSLKPEMKVVLNILRPMMESMLGNMGEHMAFAVFPGKDQNGDKIVDGTIPGKMTARFHDVDYTWAFPLASLIPKKHCPVDDKEFSGLFSYCPYHGKELK